MPELQTISQVSYQKLVVFINATLKSGLIAAQKALEYQRLKTYWEIGRQINHFAASPSEQFYRKLSRDINARTGLDLTFDTLRRMARLHHFYPKFPAKTPLSFTHYLALMRVPDAKERARLEQMAIKGGWSSPKIKLAVTKRNLLPVSEKKASAQLAFERGEPYIYYLRPFMGLGKEEAVCVDCGFKVHLPLGGEFNVRATGLSTDKNRYVRSVKKDGGYEMRLAVRKRASLYTYTASVLKIVDGDTIDALVDVGFGVGLVDRFRLRGIDAPEIVTPQGKVAKQFLVKQLAGCPLIVIRTTKEGHFGRWLADIFVLKGCSDPYQIAQDGVFLNQLLLDEGLAVIYLKN